MRLLDNQPLICHTQRQRVRKYSSGVMVCAFVKGYVRATLEESHLEPRYLELELTESVLMRDATSADSVLHALADLASNLQSMISAPAIPV